MVVWMASSITTNSCLNHWHRFVSLYAKAMEFLCALIILEHHMDTLANFGVHEPWWSNFHAGMDPDIFHEIWVILKVAQVSFQMLGKWDIGSRIREYMESITIFIEFSNHHHKYGGVPLHCFTSLLGKFSIYIEFWMTMWWETCTKRVLFPTYSYVQLLPFKETGNCLFF